MIFSKNISDEIRERNICVKVDRLTDDKLVVYLDNYSRKGRNGITWAQTFRPAEKKQRDIWAQEFLKEDKNA